MSTGPDGPHNEIDGETLPSLSPPAETLISEVLVRRHRRQVPSLGM